MLMPKRVKWRKQMRGRMGVGKANAVPDAMRKASERARKKMHVVNLSGTTIPHASSS